MLLASTAITIGGMLDIRDADRANEIAEKTLGRQAPLRTVLAEPSRFDRSVRGNGAVIACPAYTGRGALRSLGDQRDARVAFERTPAFDSDSDTDQTAGLAASELLAQVKRGSNIVVTCPELRPESDPALRPAGVLNDRQRLSPLEPVVAYRRYADLYVAELYGNELHVTPFSSSCDGFEDLYLAWTTTYAAVVSRSLAASPEAYGAWRHLFEHSTSAWERRRILNCRLSVAVLGAAERFLPADALGQAAFVREGLRAG